MCRFEPLRTVAKCLNGTEGRTRTDTMSPSPDFESGASTNSATPAHAAIITKLYRVTMDLMNLFNWIDFKGCLLINLYLISSVLICFYKLLFDK